MSFLSLEKFLYSAQAAADSTASSSDSPSMGGGGGGHFELVHNIMASIERSVLVGEAVGDLARDVKTVRDHLHQDSPPEALEHASACFDTLLRTFRERLHRADQERADDFRKVLTILNEAFGHLSSGSERSSSRLKQLETSLQRAAKSEDLRTLKNQLTDTLTYIRRQSEQDAKKNSNALLSLNQQIQLAHKAANRFGSSLSERSEAIMELAETAKSVSGEGEMQSYVASFVADVAPSLRSRHGAEVADGLLEELAQKALRPVIPDSKVYRWTDSSLVVIWRSESPLHIVRNTISGTCKELFDYRAFVGTRVATFSVPLRSVVLEAEGSPEELIENLDQFAGGVTAR